MLDNFANATPLLTQYQFSMAQRVWSKGIQAAPTMSRGYHQYQIVVSEHFNLQPWRQGRRITFHQAKIQIPVQYLLNNLMRVKDINVQAYLRIARTKSRYDWRQQVHSRRSIGRERDFAALYVPQRGKGLLHLTFQREHAPGIFVQQMSRMGKDNTSSVPFNQLKTDLVFQVLNNLCDGRLAKNEFLRCSGNMFVLGYRQKDAQMI